MEDDLNPSSELLAGLNAGREESQEQIFGLLEQLEELEKENKRLKAQTAIAHHALKYLIESNKVSAATRIYYANGAYNTIGNIRAEMPNGTDAEEE